MEDEERTSPQSVGLHRLVDRPVLDSFSLAELDDYIDQLRQEIARAEAMIARKQSHRGAADAVFGKR